MDIADIGTGLAILGTAEVSKDAVQRILAPTADYIGAGALQSTKALTNTVRVLANAAKRLGPRIDGPGQVPPRVLKNVLDEAPWIDDSLMAEYLGGIVASSYGTRTRDDRAVALQNTLQRLSTYTLRTHYICYREFYLAFRDHASWTPVYVDLKNLHLGNDSRMFASHDSYILAMDLSEEEQEQYYSIYGHSFAALDREGLLDRGQMGDRQFLKEALGASPSYEIPADGFVYKTTALGEELLLWGVGRGDLDTALVPNQEGSTDLELFDGLDLSVAEVATVTGFFRLEQLER